MGDDAVTDHMELLVGHRVEIEMRGGDVVYTGTLHEVSVSTLMVLGKSNRNGGRWYAVERQNVLVVWDMGDA